jgi:hypothetical protein
MPPLKRKVYITLKPKKFKLEVKTKVILDRTDSDKDFSYINDQLVTEFGNYVL